MLAGLDPPAGAKMESVSVKALQRTMDGLVRSSDPGEPLTVVEVQFQRDEAIYTRLVVEMALVQEESGFGPVRGVVFFAKRSLDPGTEPWASVVRSVVLEEALPKLEGVEPARPLVAAFAPVFEEDGAELEKRAAGLYRQITAGDLPHERIDALTQVFVSWLTERFRDRTQKEIAMILDLPSILETRAGREIYEEGIEQGIERGIERGLVAIARRKFGDLDMGIVSRIEALNAEAAEALLLDLLEMKSLAEFRERLGCASSQ